MRVAVAGASGRIGRLTCASLTRDGHEVVAIGRTRGVDLVTGAGLDGVLAGVDAVVDVVNARLADREETARYFDRATGNLLAAEARATVRRHVLLTVAGIHRVVGPDHYVGKRVQERRVAEGGIPWTILPATQFHDFAVTLADADERDGVATIPPLLVQPVAPADVADALARAATAPAAGWLAPLAGPEPQDLVDMARRTHRAQGRRVRLVPSWDGPFGPDMAGPVLLPGPGATLADTTFDEWLASVAGQGSRSEPSRS